jgi:tetratricopeptide (TPR) repeat protein
MRHRLMACLLVGLAAWWATEPARRGSFVYDDQHYVVDNPAVSGSASPWTAPLGDPQQALWRPLTVASFRAQWNASGRAGPFLAVNIALHIAAALLVLSLASRLGLPPPAALAAGLLFAVHPVHAEAVGWVSGRAELLATVGVLAAWRAHLSERSQAGWLAALLLCLAIASKENAFVAPLLLAVADLARCRRPFPVLRLLLLAAVATGLFAWRAAALEHTLPVEAPFGQTSLAGRLLAAGNILGLSLKLLVWPHPLRIFYHRDEFLAGAPPWWLLSLALAALVALLWRRQRAIALFLALVPLSMASVLNLVPIGATFAARFLYLPSALGCLAVGASLSALGRAELAGPRGLGTSLLLPAVALLAALPASRQAIAVFRDELTLWSHAAAAAPTLAHVRYNHGYHLERAGILLAADVDRPGAVEELEASLRLDPAHLYAGFAHVLLGDIALRGAGPRPPNPRQAAFHYRDGVQLLPGHVEARLNLAGIATWAPQVVGPAEALAVLAPLASRDDLDDEQRAAFGALLSQLSEPASQTTGTSSPEGS